VALKRVQANLKRYRAAALKAAVEGRLVPTEAELARRGGRPYEPASELLVAQPLLAVPKKAQAGVPVPPKPKSKEPVAPDTTDLPKLPEGWAWASLNSLLREPLRNGHSAKGSGGEVGIPTFTLTAVTYGDFSPANIKLTVAEPWRVEDLWAEPDDIFIERSNTPELVGTARRYKGLPNVAIFPDLLIRVRVVECILPAYVEFVLQSPKTRQYFRAKAQGISGTMPKIDQAVVQQTPIPLPPSAEQRRIVAEVERRLSVIDELEMQVDANLKRAERLRQAILKRAFEGKLVPQDPNDEPASALLERIRNAKSTGRVAVSPVTQPLLAVQESVRRAIKHRQECLCHRKRNSRCPSIAAICRTGILRVRLFSLPGACSGHCPKAWLQGEVTGPENGKVTQPLLAVSQRAQAGVPVPP
jgi:type I restriction enzyme S subunit